MPAAAHLPPAAGRLPDNAPPHPQGRRSNSLGSASALDQGRAAGASAAYRSLKLTAKHGSEVTGGAAPRTPPPQLVFCGSTLPSILGSSVLAAVLVSPLARRASSTVSRSAFSGCIRPRMSDILRG